MRTDYEHLIAKLDAFIRKYYKDRLIRGALYSAGLLVGVFLLAALLENLGHFGTTVRTALFWSVVASMLFILGRFIVVPLVKLLRLGPVISHEQAARIVGTHFTEVRDKLLNTLQLREMSLSAPQRELIEAAIAQRSRELGPVPFANAIDLRRNTRYLRYALPPLLLLLILLVAAPSLLTGPTQRLIKHGSEFIPEAPFRFRLVTEALEVPEQQDFELLVELEGDIIPQQVDLDIDGRRIPLVKQNNVRFMHRFRNVQEAVEFRFVSEGYSSQPYTLMTVPHPMLLDFNMVLEFPAYLNMPKETVSNSGDLTIPAGTHVTWSVNARSADRLDLAFDDTTYSLSPLASDPSAS